MGMDVYGVNPTIRIGTKKPERPEKLHKGASRSVVDKYFKQVDTFQNKNPGVYFRNNCWWWRPLANFIIDNCDWLTQEQQARLHDNSGFEFSQHEATTIADTLQKKWTTARQPNGKKRTRKKWQWQKSGTRVSTHNKKN